MSTYPDFNTLWDYSNPEKTRAAFERARDELEDATPDVLLQLDTQVARTHGLQRDFDRAHALLDEVASKLTPSTPIARVRYLLERGRVHNSSGDQAASAPLFHDALELAERARAHGYAVDAAHMLGIVSRGEEAVCYTHLRAHETREDLVCRHLLEKKKKKKRDGSIRVKMTLNTQSMTK